MAWKLYIGLALILFAAVLITWRATRASAPVPEGFASKVDITDLSKAILARSTAMDDLVVQKMIPIETVLKGVPASQRYLVNLAPITVTYTGYLGADVLDAAEFFKHALALGVRSFILPISTYKDDNKATPIWPRSGSPAIVYRDATGRITSRNGLSVKKVATALNNALSISSVQRGEPVLLKLQQVPGSIPNPDLNEKEYVNFMTEIADDLEPLKTSLLMQIGSYGSALGARLEAEILLQTPLSDLAGKILITTDFDVGKYAKNAYSGIKNSLLNRVHFIVRNSPAQGKISSYKTLPLSSVSSTFDVNLTRTTLQEAQGAGLEDVDAVVLALKKGIQIIPLPLFESSAPAPRVMALIQPWKGAAWAVKPEDERYTKPAPVIPATPSQALNARAAPNAQPGQIVIQ